MYTVYVLYSQTHLKIYIGYTSNLIERFKSHNELASKGYTVKYRPWTVIHCEYFHQKKAALIREKQLKSAQGRKWLHEKINGEVRVQGFISASGRSAVHVSSRYS